MHNIKQPQETNTSLAGFEPANPGIKQLQTYDLLSPILIVAQQPCLSLARLIFEVSRPQVVTNTTLGRPPLDDGSARRRGFYLITHNTHTQKTDVHVPWGILNTIMLRTLSSLRNMEMESFFRPITSDHVWLCITFRNFLANSMIFEKCV
jgi:hypothetical protein